MTTVQRCNAGCPTFAESLVDHRRRATVGVCLVYVIVSPLVAEDTQSGAPNFQRDIRPILSENCFQCHGPDENRREADLRFDTPQGGLTEWGGYAAIVPGDPDSSELYRRITSGDEDVRMPPSESRKTLTTHEIGLLRQWIVQGANHEQHWSYAAVTAPDRPPVEDESWLRNDIDRFVRARRERENIAPSPRADAYTLVRRVHFDITGLPPTVEEVDAFVKNPDPEAYAQLVDRLLASPHYGERMAAYWLDLVRFANTVGYHGDQEHAISPYRDYVIQAFNDNMPFDQFTREQLAGDLLPNVTDEQKIASGYNRLLQTSHEGGVQIKEYLAKYAADRVRNVSTVWMAATLGCAECHDHKYDPYTQRDFYSLAAFFADVDDQQTFGASNESPTSREPELELMSDADRARRKWLRARKEVLAARVNKGQVDGVAPHEGEGTLDGQEMVETKRELARVQDQLNSIAKRTRRTMITVSVRPRKTRILARGDWMDESGVEVDPAVPDFLPPLESEGERATRLDLARWLTSSQQPQTARAIVNRVWYLFFNAGISRSLDDFGAQGDWPTHPELLDYLAHRFIQTGWDVKQLVRLVVTSNTYQQSSLATAAQRQSDPENRMLARQSRHRLAAEFIRDQALATSGLLVRRIGGYSARPYQPAGYYANLNFPTRVYTPDEDENQYRRGVYVHWQRQFLHPMLTAFDAPTREECTAQRSISNTPLASLTLLNDDTFVEAARVFAQRILKSGDETDAGRIEWAWRQALSRPPQPREIRLLAQLVREEREVFGSNPQKAHALLTVGLATVPEGTDIVELASWTSLSRAILNLNETITRN